MAKGANNIPERLINFRVYADNNLLVGTGDVEMPEIAAMTDTISGPGIAGEIDSPILGHYQAMSCTINWRTIEKDAVKLAAPGSHHVELRGSQQIKDSSNGTISTVAVRVVMELSCKTFSLGTMAVASSTDSSQEFEVSYIKIFIGGNEVAEVDKYNYIAKFGGTDYLAQVRADLGIN